MNVYLMRHGKSQKHPQSGRTELSDEGRSDVLKIASWIKTRGKEIVRVVHSEKIRARQTAEIIAHHLHVPSEEIAGIGPDDSPEKAQVLIEEKKNINRGNNIFLFLRN